MNHKLTEIVTTIQHALHVIKPLVFEGVLFIWALYEMGKFLLTQVGVFGAAE